MQEILQKAGGDIAKMQDIASIIIEVKDETPLDIDKNFPVMVSKRFSSPPIKC